MAQRFYVPGHYDVSDAVALDSERSNYLCRVLRLPVDAIVEIFNEAGDIWHCQIVVNNPRKTELKVLSRTPFAEPEAFTLGIALGLIKGQPMDRALAQATELGATDIYLMQAQRSNVKLNEQRMSGKLEHWQKILVASCEQCGRVRLPRLHPPQNLVQTLAELEDPDTHLMYFDPAAVQAPTQLKPQNRVVFVGPEGGFSQEEVSAFNRYRVQGCRLGRLTLRAETMPAAALTLIQQATGWPNSSGP